MKTSYAVGLASVCWSVVVLLPWRANAVGPCGYPPPHVPCKVWKLPSPPECEWTQVNAANGTACTNTNPYYKSAGACQNGTCVSARCYQASTFEPFPVVESILYSPLGADSTLVYESGQVSGHRWRAAVSTQKSTKLSMDILRTTLSGSYTLGKASAKSLFVAKKTATGEVADAVADLPTYRDDRLLLWVNPRVTFDRKCDGTRVTSWDVVDGKFTQCLPLPSQGSGPRVVDISIGQILESYPDADPRGTNGDPCKIAVIGALRALPTDQLEFVLNLDPLYRYRNGALPSPDSIDLATNDLGVVLSGEARSRFKKIGTGSFPIKTWPGGDTFDQFVSPCASESAGLALDLNVGKFKERRLFGVSESYDLEFVFMSASGTCTTTEWSGLLQASATCPQLQADVWVDRLYGSILMVPVYSPGVDYSRCSR